MLTSELQPLARFFNRLDVRLRKLAGWLKNSWNTWPAPAKVWVALACVVGLGYKMYCLLSDG